MATLNSPTKLLPFSSEDFFSPKSETSTNYQSDDEQEDLKVINYNPFYYENASVEQQAEKTSNRKLKNELCRNYLKLGYCPYNEKCQFAHGTAELRQNSDLNAKYKTKKCSAFFKDGFCMYGERCNFLHQEPANKQ